MSTQTETNMNHKYPESLAILPEQIVSAERLIKHIEEEQHVSIWDVAYEYMQQHYPNGPPPNLTEVGEQVVEKLRRHPSLWYISPNYTCIGEYRVQGYEWMQFIWHIRNVCNVCQSDQSFEQDEVEEEVQESPSVFEESASVAAGAPVPTGYSKQQLQKLMGEMKKFISTTASVAEYMETGPDNLFDITADVIAALRKSNEEFDSVFNQLSEQDCETFNETMNSILLKMKPEIDQTQFKQFANTTLINFIISEPFTALKGQQMPIQAKMGKAKGLYFKWINQISEYEHIFKMLTKNQKSKLTVKINDSVKAEFENETVEITVQKAPVSPSLPPPSSEGYEEPPVEPIAAQLERQITPHLSEPQTPPLLAVNVELVDNRSRTPPHLEVQPPAKRVRFDEPKDFKHLEHLDLTSSPASNEEIEPKAPVPVSVKSFSFSESEQKMIDSSKTSSEELTNKLQSLVVSGEPESDEETEPVVAISN